MKIKKIIAAFLAVLVIAQLGTTAAFAKEGGLFSCCCSKNTDSTVCSADDLKEKTRLVAWNGILYELSVKALGETKSYDKKTNKVVYHRTVVEKENYYLEKDHSLLLTQTIYIHFSYDKTKAWINSRKDIEYSKNVKNDNWKFVDHIEYLNDDPDQCLFSAIFKLYNRESKVNDWDYKDTAFFDVICTPDGQLSYQYK